MKTQPNLSQSCLGKGPRGLDLTSLSCISRTQRTAVKSTKYTPLKFKVDIQNSHIWKEIRFLPIFL